MRIETWGALDFDAGAGQKGDAPAKRALQPIVLARIEKDSQQHEYRRRNKKMKNAENPKNRAAKHEQGVLHI
jgi:hypothetical protein